MDATVQRVSPEHGLLTRAMAGWRSRSDIPLRLSLWNGFAHDLGPDPRVAVRLPGPAALRYFLPPSLDNLAEAYVNGHFDVLGGARDIVEAASRLAHTGVSMRGRFGRMLSTVRHNRARDARAIEHYYDVSNDFHRLWLDEQMVYSCAYFPTRNESLDEAQGPKLDHILAKIMLKPGERLLDIGCAWGALAIRAAQRFGGHSGALGTELRTKRRHDSLHGQRDHLSGMAHLPGGLRPRVRAELGVAASGAGVQGRVERGAQSNALVTGLHVFMTMCFMTKIFQPTGGLT